MTNAQQFAEKFIRKIILLLGDRKHRRFRVEGFICKGLQLSINDDNESMCDCKDNNPRRSIDCYDSKSIVLEMI
jgi:hypothetical protein